LTSALHYVPLQIEDEIGGALEFMEYTYDAFGFTFELELSTRPENFLGTVDTWDL